MATPVTVLDPVSLGVTPGMPEQPDSVRAHQANTIVQEMRTGEAPFIRSCCDNTGFSQSLLTDFEEPVNPTYYVVPFGINRGAVMLSVMAVKIAVNFVMFALVGDDALQPSPSSE